MEAGTLVHINSIIPDLRILCCWACLLLQSCPDRLLLDLKLVARHMLQKEAASRWPLPEMRRNYRLQCHKTLPLDSFQLKAFLRNSILMCHQVGMCITARQSTCSEARRVLHRVQISGTWIHYHHPQQIPSHFTVWVSQLFHGCYSISLGSGEGHQAQWQLFVSAKQTTVRWESDMGWRKPRQSQAWLLTAVKVQVVDKIVFWCLLLCLLLFYFTQ